MTSLWVCCQKFFSAMLALIGSVQYLCGWSLLWISRHARKTKPRRQPQTVRATIYRVLLTCIVVFSTYCSKIRACSRIETSSSLWTPGNCAYSYRLRKLPGLDWIVALGAQVLSGAFHFGRLDSRYHAE